MSIIIAVAALGPVLSSASLPPPKQGNGKDYSIESSTSISKKKWKIIKADPPKDLPRYQLSQSVVALNKMDTNNDGVIDKDEIRRDFRLKYGKSVPVYYLEAKERQTVANFMIFYDKDKSGTISQEEMRLGEEKANSIKNQTIKGEKARKS